MSQVYVISDDGSTQPMDRVRWARVLASRWDVGFGCANRKELLEERTTCMEETTSDKF